MGTFGFARFIGESRDGRTNRWKITCPGCGYVFEPQTTRLATQILQCPKQKCKVEMFCDYNADPATVMQVVSAEKGQNHG